VRRLWGVDALSPEAFRHPVVSIGVFDGVHRGHRHLLESLRTMADRLGGEAVVLTFDTHPRVVLEGGPPKPILSLRHRLLLLERLGVDTTVVLPFDEATRDTSYERFVEDVLVHRMRIRGLLFGYNTNFGKGGLGTFAAVEPLAAKFGFVVAEAPPISTHGLPISSTQIRAAIESGRLADAEALLGRPHSLLGTVVHGDGRGRTLGFPTANLDVEGELLPPAGVYQVVVTLRGQRFAAVANVGTRPTFPEARPARPLVEVHVPGLSQDFYGEALEVELVRKIRDEVRFESREALVEQIRRDVASLGPRPA
jgi:riboflavin kinase/FMN adenylyltransferase